MLSLLENLFYKINLLLEIKIKFLFENLYHKIEIKFTLLHLKSKSDRLCANDISF